LLLKRVISDQAESVMAKLRIRIDDGFLSRMQKIADAGGYSSVEEFMLHVLGREINRLDSGETESEDEIRKKLEGLGYLT
jgi:hypothetical protein